VSMSWIIAGIILNVFASANTMSSCLEVLGISLPYSASIPATWPGNATISGRLKYLKLFFRLRKETRMLSCGGIYEEPPR